MTQTKNPISLKYKAILTMLAAVLLASCTNLISRTPQDVIGGGIDQGDNSARGALTVSARVSNGTSRYAMPTIPELVYAATLYKSIESPEYEKFVEGAKATDSDNLIFSFQRPDDTSGTFTLEVFAFVKAAGETATTFSRAGALLSGGKDGLAIDDDSDEIQVSDPIALSSSKSGTVSLKVTVPEGCSLEIDDTAKTNFAVEGTSPDFILTQNGDGIPAGAYPVIFNVKKGAENVHVFTESINVINGLCTDTWSGQEKGDAKVITQSAISSTVFVRGESAPWYASNAPSATASDGNSGSYLSPFATIQKAVDKIIAINDGTSEYTIYVDGTFTTSSDALADFNAVSQTLSVKIVGLSTSEKAVLDGGDTACGIVVGSTSAQKDVNLSLENLVIQNAKNPGSVVIRGGAIMLCCKADNSHTIKNCEIKNNRAAYGSAIYSEYGSLDLQGCVISGNMTSANGAVSILYGATLTISSDVRIENNTFVGTQYGGGVYVGADCDFTMTGGTISGNTATYGGGGVYVVAGGTFTMTGGTISGGNAKIGGGVYVAATSTAVGTFEMSGSASVPAGEDGKNDVYLSAYGSNFATITVAGDLTADSPVATITPSAYAAERPILTKGAGAPAITQDICDKFALSPNPAGGIWQIVPDGTGANGVLTRPDTIYLNSSSGSDTNSGLTASKAVQTLKRAIELYDTYNAQKIMVCAAYTLSSGESGLLNRAGKTKVTLMRYDGSSDVSDALTGNLLTISQGSVDIVNTTLDGNKDNVTATKSLLVISGSDTIVTLGTDATLCNNKTSSSGGAVYIKEGTFEMTGGIISGNTTSDYGGGVCVYGTFTLKGGTIGGTTSAEANTAKYGGGVCVLTRGKFTMEGGTISGNTTSNYGCGGGVYVYDGTVTMSGGTISGNTALDEGGGVFIAASGMFTMEKGTISGNTATYYGGGVYIYVGTFTLKGGTIGGTISGNTAKNGGGVYNNNTFEMTGGEIKGNTATTQGGGVYNTASATFTNTGGTVSDNFLSDNTPDDVYPAP